MTQPANKRKQFDMPKRKEPELDPKEQYTRFKKAAAKAGVTKSEKEFERAFGKVAKATASAAKPTQKR